MAGHNQNYYARLPILTADKKEEVPFGERKCILCQLPLLELKELHNHKFEEGWTYKQITAHIKARYNYTTSTTKIVAHFVKHCGKLKQSEELSTKLSIAFSPQNLADKNKNLSPATVELQKSTRLFSETITKMSKIISQKINLVQLDQYVSEMNPMSVVKDWARFLKELRELLHAVNTLRSPKIVIDELLERIFKEMAEDTARILNSNCNTIMINIQTLFRKHNIEFDNLYFREFIQQIIIDFTTKMNITYKDFKVKVAKTLDDLENVI